MIKNKYAVALGRMAKGKKKTMTPAALAARCTNLELARLIRWLEKKIQQTP